MTPVWSKRWLLATVETLVAVGAFGGFVGLVSGSLDFGRAIEQRLPFASATFAACALLLIVGAPMAIAAVSTWRSARASSLFAMVAGSLLAGWIIIELAIIQAYSWMQPFFFAVGLVIALSGYRAWHLTWGATDDEVTSAMPGDEIAVPKTFLATRAISIDASLGEVWPWLAQVGIGRAGFYSYDFLDNPGHTSAWRLLQEHQDVAQGSLAAPMSLTPTPRTSFVVASAEAPTSLVWAKADAVWAWRLVFDGRFTRLVTRLRTGPVRGRPVSSLLGAVLMECGDFPMMRKMLLGIKARAESSSEVSAGGAGVPTWKERAGWR